MLHLPDALKRTCKSLHGALLLLLLLSLLLLSLLLLSLLLSAFCHGDLPYTVFSKLLGYNDRIAHALYPRGRQTRHRPFALPSLSAAQLAPQELIAIVTNNGLPLR